MDIAIEFGQTNDIDELEQLYNDLNDYLAKGVNYPGWIKGIYPIRQNALMESKTTISMWQSIMGKSLVLLF